MKKQSKTDRRFEPRIRFNWGFHDGAADQRSGFVALWNRGAVAHHFDRTYVEGYYAGRDAVKAGLPTESSQPAWEAR
jgi:hypothetical protein